MSKKNNVRTNSKNSKVNRKNTKTRFNEFGSKKKVDVWGYKKYICKARIIPIETGQNIIILREDEAKANDIYTGYRTMIKYKNKKIAAIVDTSRDYISKNEVGIYKDMADKLHIKNGENVKILHMNMPKSLGYIKKKMNGGTLDYNGISTIVKDIMNNTLSEAETSAWITSAYIRGFSDDETVALTRATVESGSQLDLKKKYVLDKHCVGGVAGNRTTMLVVPIIASIPGLYIPKTSSRAITSAAGTADTMEVLANVNISEEELKRIVLKTKGSIVWGGGVNLAPVDDKLIKIRHPLSIDPEGMLLASILGKKKSVNSKYLIIDIPIGRGAKISDLNRANALAKRFLDISKRLDIKTEVLVTDGAEPVGNGIGPVLEAIDVLKTLENKKDAPLDLKHKGCVLAGKLLEVSGKVKKGEGYDIALSAINSGKALKKMKEIIGAQGGNPKVKSTDLQPGRFDYTYTAETSGQIFHIDNKIINKIARIAGSPMDKTAGVVLYKSRGDIVKKGEPLFTVYSESEGNIDVIVKTIRDLEPVEMRRMLLGVVR